MELRGTLDQPGPLLLVKLLVEAGQSGSLSATSGRFSGVLVLEGGRILGATVGQEPGRPPSSCLGSCLAAANLCSRPIRVSAS